MIIDSLANFERYANLNPLFPAVAQFLRQNDLATLPTGRHVIQGDDLYVNIVDAQPKTQQQARIETHDKMIDIQIPISGGECQGWTPRQLLPQAPYNTDDDISFYAGDAQTYLNVQPGQFTIFFTWDGHAPAITATTLRKAIFKVKA
ncbi:MAG: YhcH/YjgK/YiaL family protein [Bacteroidaceae bacterium]|nr:YhcH/YjgK/YiaL family protein [Bacteroidaceae bacterium]